METQASILLACPACKKPISSAAHSCPHCGEPLNNEWEASGRTKLKRQRTGCAILLIPFLIGVGVVVFIISTAPDRPVASQMQLPPPRPYNPADAEVLRKVQEAVRNREAMQNGRPAKDDDVLRDLKEGQKSKIESNVVISKGAIVCQSLTNAQIVVQLVKIKQEEKIKSLDGCWFIPKGKELMGLQVAGQYALIAPIEQLSSKGWTPIDWLQEK
jgi:hypothetical protein